MAGEAFIGVLACARAADSAFPDAERNLLDLICRTHIFTRDLGDEGYKRAAMAVKNRLAEVGWEVAIVEYLARLPREWGYTTILSVIDICLIDADEDTRELTCIASVAERFAIPLEEIHNFMHWFRVKNGMLGGS